MARLDRLRYGREVAQIGAVIGREFSHEMLCAVAGQTTMALDSALAELVRSELIFRTGPASYARYTFKHVLVQQAIYESLLRSRRQDLHARVANAIVERFPDEADDRWHLLLHHATLAGDHALAARACIAAGERSLQIFAPEEAYRLAERGLEHLEGLPDREQKVLFRIKLLATTVFMVHKHRDKAPELINRLQAAADAAMALGFQGEAIPALHAISYLQQWSNDAKGASEATLRAEEASRKSDAITRCHQVANTGRCLLEVDQQIPRALALVDEAKAMARTLELDFVELEWARAHTARWQGDLDSALELMSRAVTLARRRAERWREVECLIWLAMIDFERRNLSSVERYCDEIDEIAGRLNYMLPPVSAAFRVLAKVYAGGQDVLAALGRALASLRDFDDKAHLAYVLNFAADDALSQGLHTQARAAATEALAAARAMPRATEIVIATAILARIDGVSGDRAAAAARLQALASEYDPTTLSARARAYLEQAARDLGLALQSPPTTETPRQTARTNRMLN